MKRKRVYIRSHGPLSIAHDVEIGWEDVWLRVCSRRRTLRLAPCLVSHEHLLSDLYMAEQLASDSSTDPDLAVAFQRDADELRATLRDLDRLGYVIDQAPSKTRKGFVPGRDFTFANVYTRRPWIDHAEAERMLDAYLAAIGIHNGVYKWKRPRFIAWPTTVNVPTTERSAA